VKTKKESYVPALGFDWLTPFYDICVRLTTRETIFKQALIDQAGFESTDRVLDLGCGTGTLAILIKKTRPQTAVFGIDGDLKILEIARTKARESNLAIDFEQGMSFDLPYAEASFDRVVSSLFFHHLSRESKRRTLQEVFRVLRPDGELHIADWGLPASFLMKAGSLGVKLLDGRETTTDNFSGLLPVIIEESGFRNLQQTRHFNSLFGTIRLLKAQK